MHLIRAYFKERLAEEFIRGFLMMLMRYLFLIVFIKAFGVATHLNCLNLLSICYNKEVDTNKWAVT